MATIRTYPMQNSTILRTNSDKEFINTNPEYQRNGEVWTLEKKRLLIDSILNDYDIPKLYFHLLPKLSRELKVEGVEYDYAIIDGRQRLEAIWGFLEGEFTLSDEFEFLADESVQAKKFTYADLAKEYPKLRVRFDSYVLPIFLVETDDIELIEDMFSRLNEAVPLNAAEKRNAFGGLMAKAVRNIADHVFFTESVRFSIKRFQYREVAARLLFVEYCYLKSERLFDTKKPYLDRMVKSYKENNNYNSENEVNLLYNRTYAIVSIMAETFVTQDVLLRSQAVITVYYMVFRVAMDTSQIDNISRAQFFRFFEALSENRKIAEFDLTGATYDYLEFDRLSQQGTNDSASIRERSRILCDFLEIESGTAFKR